MSTVLVAGALWLVAGLLAAQIVGTNKKESDDE